MASRRAVRESFYSELEAAVDGLLDADRISQQYPGADEALPRIVHDDDYRPIPINRGAAPIDQVTDQDGVQTEIYASPMECRFTVTIVSDDEQEKEDLYEAIRSHFEEFEHPIRDASEIQEDVHDVSVEDSSSTDDENREPTGRADALLILIGYLRKPERDVDPLTDVQQNVDADDDGTTDNTYTTN